MIESREPEKITPFQKEKPPKTEEAFDELRFEAELRRIEDYPWHWAYRKPNGEEVKALNQEIIKDADILAEALAVEDKFYGSLTALNRLASMGEKEIRATAISILEKNMPIIEGYLRRHKDLACLDAANNLVEYGNEKQQNLGMGILSEHIDALASSIKTSQSPYQIAPILETIVKRGGADSIQKALLMLQNSILEERTGQIREGWLLGWSFMNKDAKIREIANSVIRKKLASYGLNIEKFLDAWGVSLPMGAFDSREKIIKNNIVTIEMLEFGRPGIVNFLNKTFGIYDFGRYPVEMLLWQYDNYDNDELPYGVILYPRDDNNGAFYQNNAVFRQLFEQLKGRFGIRIGEAGDKIEIVKFLHKLNRKYGERHKISFAIIGGHGDRYGIKFGGEDQKHSLSAWDLYDERHPTRRKAEYFESEPTFILNSCGTGAEQGIAEILSSEMKATIIAPSEPTGIKSIRVEIKNKKPVFSVEYSKEGSAQTYVSGKTSSD